jgi:membrane fusion protein, multidrug efflux system
MSSIWKSFSSSDTVVACLIVSALITGIGCSNASSAGRPPEPPTVEVAEVVERDVPIYSEWIGTLDGLVNADIKAQVSGYLMEQKYTEGSFVKKGQVLFQIDPRPFQAAVDQANGRLAQANGQLAQARAQLVQAEAQLTVAEANQGRTQLDVDRYVPLAKQQAISQQELDNATQNNLAAKAQMQAARAAVETAKAQIQAANAGVEASKASVETEKLNLEFTRLVSPIDGVAGIAQQQVGALVSPAGGPVTTVSTLDPIKAYFTLSEQEYLALTQRSPNQGSRDAGLSHQELELILSDGSVYPRKGHFYVADRQVSQSTGSLRLAALFPNPGNQLRPGQYGRVRAETSTRKNAMLVPQRAVSELQGSYQLAVVDPQNVVSIRPVKVGSRTGTMWMIEDGVRAGERVIVEGTQKAGPGSVVNPKPFVDPKETPGR